MGSGWEWGAGGGRFLPPAVVDPLAVPAADPAGAVAAAAAVPEAATAGVTLVSSSSPSSRRAVLASSSRRVRAASGSLLSWMWSGVGVRDSSGGGKGSQ